MILAVSVCTRSGKVLLSRPFESVSADKMQELFGNFSKLAQQGIQHTTFEADELRYIYEPLEELFVVLVTDLRSNILQDIKTLHLLAQCVGSQVSAPTEAEICESAFEIISAVDEVVSNGYAESLSLQQVETFLEMDSYAEKIEEIVQRNKEIEAAEERKRKARDLEEQRRNKAQGGAFGGSDYIDAARPQTFAPSPVPATTYVATPEPAKPTLGRGGAPKGRGLQLGKKKQESSAPLLPTLATNRPSAASAASAAPAARVEAAAAPAGSSEVEISIQEQLTIDATRNGDVRTARVAGSLHLYAGDRDNACLKIKTKTGGPANAYKINPKMDRGLFTSDRTLGLRNAQESFPASNVLLLKWTVDEIKAPISFSVWVSESSDPGFLSITVEYELAEDFSDTLDNVQVKIPLPHPNAHVLDPSSVYDQEDGHIIWMIPTVNSANPTGTFDFTAEGDNEDSFFPLEASLAVRNAATTFGLIEVTAIENQLTGASVPFTTQVVAETDTYAIR